jgi:glycosyltransferase involved in cell wall biosynthesis
VTNRSTALDIGVFGARSIPSTYSGYETFLTTLLPKLADRGHRVTLYTRTTDEPNTGPYEGVERVRLAALPGKQFNTLSHGAVAAVWARAKRHDVVLVVNVSNAAFCALNRWTGQPIVLNTDGQEWLRGKWGKLARAVFHGSARISRHCANGLISDCNAMADIYRTEFAAESSVIPYCYPDVAVRGDSEVLERLHLERGAYFVIAGRLNPENNIDAVAHAYAATKHPEPLLVLGAANYNSPVARELEALAARDARIRVGGHLGDRAEFLDVLGRAKAYIHGHSVGGMNPSLVEAMRAGAVVLAFDTQFNREVLSDTGRFFTVAELDRSIAELKLLNAADVEKVRDRAIARAETEYGIEPVVDAYEELLRVAATVSPRARATVRTRWDMS